MPHYRCYDLMIRSDLALPELLPAVADAPADVTVERGPVSVDGLPGGRALGPYLSAAPGAMALSVPGIARYRVENGSSIRYDPWSASVDEDSIRLFLLGSGFGAMLMQRGFLVLHGNAFAVGGGCVLCVGNAGAGKSTMAAAMMQRGYRILADDVCPVDTAGRAIPGMARIKLWQDSAALLGIDTATLPRVRPELEKFSLPLRDAFCDRACPVRAVYVLGIHQDAACERREIEGFDRFTALKANTYRFRYLTGMGGADAHMAQCAALAQRIAMVRIDRPAKAGDVNTFADVLERDMRERGLI